MKNFTLLTHTEPDMAVTHFDWHTDDENNALIAWTWPGNEKVKYMLVAATDEETDDPLQWLMNDPQRHTVVTRNLSARYTAPIGRGRKRYLLAPAYLQGKEIAVYGPALVTDWLYAKTRAEVRISNRPLPFSLYKRVRFSLRFSDGRGAELGKKALRYALYEYNRLIGTYPLDDAILSGGYMHIRKSQHIRFIIEGEFAHLVTLI
jgi:hypothetical protein